jgi:hypothetical protein
VDRAIADSACHAILAVVIPLAIHRYRRVTQ